MMKQLDVQWNPLPENTSGYLHTLPYAAATAARYAGLPYEHLAAETGFAFRIWVDGQTLCPSAMSIWDFGLIPSGLREAGYQVRYVSRQWNQDDVETARRLEALEAIKASVDRGAPAVAWDVGTTCEWGLVLGYDDDAQEIAVLDITGHRGTMPYEQLGKRDLPLLDVTSFEGYTAFAPDVRLRIALTHALNHGLGKEWAGNPSGPAAYGALAKALNPTLLAENWGSAPYYLGTYCDLRYAAWQYLAMAAQRHPNLTELAQGYQQIYRNLWDAFCLTRIQDKPDETALAKMSALVAQCGPLETRCIEQIQRFLHSFRP